MSEEKEGQKQESISRRKFTIGSLGLLSAYALTQDSSITPLSAQAQAIKLRKTQTVQDLMEARHILDEDIRRVIEHAERTGEKLYQPGSNRFLSKLRVRETYFYVEYEPTEDAYEVHTAYSHRFLLGKEE